MAVLLFTWSKVWHLFCRFSSSNEFCQGTCKQSCLLHRLHVPVMSQSNPIPSPELTTFLFVCNNLEGRISTLIWSQLYSDISRLYSKSFLKENESHNKTLALQTAPPLHLLFLFHSRIAGVVSSYSLRKGRSHTYSMLLGLLILMPNLSLTKTVSFRV